MLKPEYSPRFNETANARFTAIKLALNDLSLLVRRNVPPATRRDGASVDGSRCAATE
jgi:hypothetical protein